MIYDLPETYINDICKKLPFHVRNRMGGRIEGERRIYRINMEHFQPMDDNQMDEYVTEIGRNFPRPEEGNQLPPMQLEQHYIL
jgi:hypothetical protein